MPHLWEVDHPYYCSQSNYYAPGIDQPCDKYKNFAAFMSEYRDADFDMNLVFRFDWREGEDWDLPEYNGDDYYRCGLLLVYWLRQRKGIYGWSEIEVCRADESAVIEFLRPRFEHLKKLWEPVNDT